MVKENKIAKNKALGTFLLFLALLGFALFTYRLCVYVYEYDPQYSPIDYGKYNILSYFTVQSNFFAYVYLLFTGLSLLGVNKCKKFAFNPTVQCLMTVYVLFAGITYCGGFPLGMTPPLKWDTTIHAMSSFIQVYYHMIMPVVVLTLAFFPFTNEKISRKAMLISCAYPLAYSVFSVIRGAYSNPTYYPYPFYNPEFIWDVISKKEEINYLLSYVTMFGLLIVGMSLFAGFTAVIRIIHNKRCK